MTRAASLATAPALVISGGVVAITGAVATLLLAVLLRPWTAGGQIVHPVVGALLGFGVLASLGLGGIFVLVSVLISARVGWVLGDAGSIRGAFEQDAVLRAVKGVIVRTTPLASEPTYSKGGITSRCS
jgi:hypothetical protein